MLKEKEIFPFNLHVYNSGNKKHTLFLYANSPLDNEKKEFLEFLISKGAILSILMDQKLTFLKEMNLKEESVEDLKKKIVHPLVKKQLKNLEKLEKAPVFNLQEEIQEAILYDNYIGIIERARMEIMAFKMTISPTVSFANVLAEKLLTTDNITNRIVALSYFLAKIMNISDEEGLSDLICASFLSHIGLTQIDRFYSYTPTKTLSSEKELEYRKHVELSQHLIKKSRAELSERCLKIIQEHHERWDGRGHPYGTKGEFLDTLSLVLGSVAHIIEYSSGKIAEEKRTILSTIHLIENKIFTPGLEFEFGAGIYDNLVRLIKNNSQKQEKLSA